MKQKMFYTFLLIGLVGILLSGCSRAERRQVPNNESHPTLPTLFDPQQPARPTLAPTTTQTPETQANQPKVSATVVPQDTVELNKLADDIDQGLDDLEKDIQSVDTLDDLN